MAASGVANGGLKLSIRVVFDRSKETAKEIEDAVLDLMTETADFALKRAQETVHVDRDVLRPSGHRTGQREENYVIFDAANTSDIPYGGFHEMGTRYTKSYPFLRPAMIDAFEHFVSGLGDIEGRFS